MKDKPGILFLSRWFLTLFVFAYSMVFAMPWFFLCTLGAFFAELMMNTFRTEVVFYRIEFKAISGAAIFVAAAWFQSVYLALALLGLAFAVTAIESENNNLKRIGASALGGAVPTASMVYLGSHTGNIYGTTVNTVLFFLAFFFLLLGTTRYKNCKIIFVTGSLLPAVCILTLSFERFRGSSGVLISFGWDWLIALPFFGCVMLVFAVVFIWAAVKHKRTYVIPEKAEKLEAAEEATPSDPPQP